MKFIMRMTLFLSIALLLSACAMVPAYKPLQSERFGSRVVEGRRIAVIVNMPDEYISGFATPLANELTAELNKSGFEVTSDVQVTDPLALGSEVSFGRARRFVPDAYLVVRFSQGSSYGNVSLRLETVSAQMQGIWRGRLEIRRIREAGKETNKIANEIVDHLFADGAISSALKGYGA